MSGIFGIVFFNDTIEQLEKVTAFMSSELEFRGDIVELLRTGERSALGVRHFSEEKLVPAFSDSKCNVVFEGEIYNKNQLIEELNLTTYSGEGEIISSAYKKFGLDFAKTINGVFTIALYDKEKRQVLLVRDHVGSRSLFYAKNNHGVFFATTIKSILRTGRINSRLSIKSIQSFFSSTSISPPDTMYSEIFCLRPGTLAILSDTDGVREHTYWKIRDIQEDYGRTLHDFSCEARELIMNAVQLRSQIGGRFGSIVSGGVDSSVVTALLAQNSVHNTKLPVFSIVFDEKPYSDEYLQKIMYNSFNLDPHSAVITAKEYWEILLKAVENQDCPVNDDAVVGMYRVFKLARSVGCSVLFEGEAADELFFTGHVHAERKFQKFLTIPFGLRKIFLSSLFKHTVPGAGLDKKIRRFLFKLGLSDTDRRLLVLPSFYHTSRSILREELSRDEYDPLATARSYLLETNLKDPLNIYYYGLLKSFLPDDLLFKNERAASANKINNRTPFIDYRLVELAFKIPQKFKVRKPSKDDDGTKIIYKKAMEGIIPDEILKRKKTRGFSIPSSEWYRDQLKDEVHNLLFGRDAQYPEYLDNRYVEEVYLNHKKNIRGFDGLMNSLVIFEIWLRKHTTNRS